MSASKDKLVLIEDKRRKKKGLSDFVRNKYAVGSAVLLVIIIILVVIALRPPKSDDAEVAEDAGSDVIYIIDEQGNMVAAPATEDDSIVLQNQKEEEDPTVLAYNADTREGYMNNCVFLGDSRTVAMVSYGYISDSNALAKVGISHWQVSSTTFTQNSGNQYTLSDYLRAHSEPVIYVCYGVNGMNGMAEDKYKSTYEELVDKIVSLAGERKVVLMAIWPVDDNGSYRGSVKNEWIDKYNTFLFDMAKKKGLYYLNIAPALKDDKGSIKKEYDSGDGLHYKASAYKDILDFIIHHPVPGISDEGDFVVHYVKPKGEYKDIMTETPDLPQNTQLENDDYQFVLQQLFPTLAPTQAPADGQNTEQGNSEGQQEQPGGQENADGQSGGQENADGQSGGQEDADGQSGGQGEQQGESHEEQHEEQNMEQSELEKQIQQYREEQLRQQQEWQQE